MVTARTHLEEREFLVEERCAHRRVKKAKEGTLRAYADVKVCAHAYAWLWVRDVGGGYNEVG